ncbi:tetratricopeptide repeat protein [Candidatus Marithioploca araucensis]|uniref:Tetratricopeptide repeat protein n=1 Tax=Candidatus Marithioploca araucensis TaxID=70273 RepID=A0ABT7VW68_9GAMM|nr:tetratricopeptide repeat protein [Candidatus Marithioploca araucensis]
MRILNQIIITLILPITLWAAAPCDQATKNVIKVYHLRHTLSQARQKSLLQQALNFCPNHAQAHNNLGVLLEKEDDNTAALYHYRQAVSSQPDYVEAWLGIGDILYKQGQYPLSLEAYLQICTKHPRARLRITELLRGNRYRTVDGSQVMGHESLSLLFDKTRLQGFYQKVINCRQIDKSIAPNLGATKMILEETTVIFRPFHFKVGQHDLSLISEAQCDEVATSLINKENILIYGHSDSQDFANHSERESDYLNWQLSQNRAESVKAALAQRGVLNMKTFGYGDSRPLVSGESEAALAQNRRVEIEVVD